MVKTLKNRRNKKTGTKRAIRGGLFGLSSTVQKMRSFDKADFKRVLDYLDNNTSASEYIESILNTNNSKMYDFAHLKKLYLYFKDLLNESYYELNTPLYSDVENILTHFKFIVNSVHSKKTGAPTPVVKKNA